MRLNDSCAWQDRQGQVHEIDKVWYKDGLPSVVRMTVERGGSLATAADSVDPVYLCPLCDTLNYIPEDDYICEHCREH